MLYGIIYYLIFRKHHKRNKIELGELVSLVTKFYSITIISTIIIIFGIYFIIDANSYKDERNEVITRVSLGILLISATIINYIFYIKRSLKDLDLMIREENKKRTLKIGETLELIFFTIFIFTPIWRITDFIKIYKENGNLIIEIIKSLVISLIAIFLMYQLNPADIRNKILKREHRHKTDNSNKENENVIESGKKDKNSEK